MNLPASLKKHSGQILQTYKQMPVESDWNKEFLAPREGNVQNQIQDLYCTNDSSGKLDSGSSYGCRHL